MSAAVALAMRSPVNWAVLCSVIDRARYGYELGQRLVAEQERLRAGAMLTWIQFAQRELRDAGERRR